MPKKKLTNYEKIKNIFSKKLPSQPLTYEERSFIDAYEYDMEVAEDNGEEFKRTNAEKGRYQRLKIIQQGNKDAYENVKKQICDAYKVKEDIKDKYNKKSWWSRTFSHLVPNSWTEAGRMRNEMAECDKAYREAGYSPKAIENGYHMIQQNKFEDGTFEMNNLVKAEKSSFTRKGYYEKAHDIADLHIGDAINLDEVYGYKEEPDDDELEEDYTKEKFTVNEANQLNEQSSDLVNKNDNKDLSLQKEQVME